MFGHQYPGFYVAFEGGEGGGKTTQIKLLIKRLRVNFPEREVLTAREPGGPRTSEEIRNILHDPTKGPEDIHPRTEALLYAAARSEFLEQVARPVLVREAVFLSDRCWISSEVYQGLGRGLGSEYIKKINGDLVAELSPDLVILLDLDPEVGLARRVSSGEVNRMDKEEIGFYRMVREGYLSIARENPGYFVVIDASLSVERQAGIIWGEVSPRLLNWEAQREMKREVEVRRERE